MGMFSQNELLLMILVVSVLLIFIVILTILDIKEYKKEKDLSLDDLKDLDNTVINENIVDIKPLESEAIEVLEVPDEEKSEILQIDDINENIEPLKIQEEIKFEEVNNQSNVNIIEEFEPHKLSLNEELNKIEETMVDTDEKL